MAVTSKRIRADDTTKQIIAIQLYKIGNYTYSINWALQKTTRLSSHNMSQTIICLVLDNS